MRFSKYGRLLRTVAWIRRFVCNSRLKEEDRLVSRLTGLEIQEASFSKEIASVKRHNPLNNSNLANLNPFLCPTSGLLHMGGRIYKSLLLEVEKHPIILPSNHPVVKLLIDDVHCRELRAALYQHTMSTHHEAWPA